MNKIPPRPRAGNARQLSLFDYYADHRRWQDAPPAARMIRRRCGIASPATARAIAEAAGFPVSVGGDR